MKIFYQGERGAYSNLAGNYFGEKLGISEENIKGLNDFESIWQEIELGNLGVLPIENSYAGSIHYNIYNFLKYDFLIVGEFNLEINHCICSLETDISKVKKAFSHEQALAQTYKYLKSKNIKPEKFADTAGAAKYIMENNLMGSAAICSELGAKIYGLNILEKQIQDQDGNTTKFALVVNSDLAKKIEVEQKFGKTSIIFETNDTPSCLYKVLGAFATNGINLKKVESLPSYKTPFSYMFFVTFDGNIGEEKVENALDEIEFFTNYLKIIGNY